jgi:uncharacterized protein (UPF0335 family)
MSAEEQIRQFAERIVRLEEERKALAADIKDLKAEAKAAGFSPKLIATCVRIMLMEAEKRAEALAGHEELDLYLGAVGLIARREVEPAEQVSRESASEVSQKRPDETGGCESPAGNLASATEKPLGVTVVGFERETVANSRFGASDLDQSVCVTALNGTRSRARGENARHLHSSSVEGVS